MDYLLVFLFILAGYLLGSVNAAVILSKAVYGSDIREHGSGNAGTTNMLRTFGKAAAGFTLLIDFLKGIVACLLPFLIVYLAMGDRSLGLLAILGAACGAVCGHNWPVYFDFKGGKGVLISFSVMLFLAPFPALIALGVFILVVSLTRFVSLGSILAAASFPVSVFFLGGWAEGTRGFTTFFVVSTVICLLLIVRHHANIGRLLHGKESKLSFHKKEVK